VNDRLFLALWPPAPVRERIVALQHGLHWPDGTRPTPPEKLHVTLHFIGAVARDRLDELRSGLAVPWSDFDLRFESTASFQRGRSAVLLAREIPDGLLSLHAALAAKLAALGLPVEQRRYRPHVTLSYKAQGLRLPARIEPVDWPARDGYSLVRSLPGGAGYEDVARFPAGA
jgi:2'-5' RNA ligase